MTGRLPPHYSMFPNSRYPNYHGPLCIKSLLLPGVHEENHLNIHSDMTLVVKAMANPESGLEVRDRMWLKITIHNAFIGENLPSLDPGPDTVGTLGPSKIMFKRVFMSVLLW